VEGKVKFFHSKDGTGFIVASDGRDYFFNRASIKTVDGYKSEPYSGDSVEFTLMEGGLVGTWVVKPGTLIIIQKSSLNLTVLQNREEIRNA
jgi:cold shock CspA family protein